MFASKTFIFLDWFVALLGKQCIGRVSIHYLFSRGKCHNIHYQYSAEISSILFLYICHFKKMDRWREVVQDGDEVKFWTPLLPQTHQIYGYISSNSFWKRPDDYLNSSFTLNEKGATSRQVGEAETGSHHKPHPWYRDPQSGETEKLDLRLRWGAKAFFLH